jgi:hypothetical protein
MKIYVTHASSFDFKKELYEPIRQSQLDKQHDITLPHEKSDKPLASKEYLQKRCNLVIAEVSYPSTGVGIELGWANTYGVPIICIHKTGTRPSLSLHKLTQKFIEYHDSNELITKLTKFISR